MTDQLPLGEQAFHQASAPAKVFPKASWADNLTLGLGATNIADQYGTQLAPSTAAM